MIEELHYLVNEATGKGQSAYHPPERVDAEAHAESLALFSKYYRQFEETQEVSDYLRPFVAAATVALVGGKAGLPPGFAHPLHVGIDGANASIIKHGDWLLKTADPLCPPTAEHPACRFVGDGIEALPGSSETAELCYLRLPAKPKYAYNVVDGRVVFDPANSVGLEWPETLLGHIANRVLANLGVGDREYGLVGYSNAEKSKEP